MPLEEQRIDVDKERSNGRGTCWKELSVIWFRDGLTDLANSC